MDYEYNIENLTPEELKERMDRKMQIVKEENKRMIITMVIVAIVNVFFILSFLFGVSNFVIRNDNFNLKYNENEISEILGKIEESLKNIDENNENNNNNDSITKSEEIKNDNTLNNSEHNNEKTLEKTTSNNSENIRNNNNNNDAYIDYDLRVLDDVYWELMVEGNEEYLENFSSEEIALIRNVFFATKGYIFTKEKYKRYFEKKPWYRGYTKYPNLDKEEQEFVEILKQYE